MAQAIQNSDLDDTQSTPQQAGQSGATPGAGSSAGTSSTSAGTNPSGAGQVKAASGAEAQPAGGYQQNTGQPSGGSTASPPAAQPYNPNQQQGSGYTNIQQVLNANKNNQLSNTVGSGIQGQTNQAQANLGQSQQQFNQGTAANQANTQANSQLVQNVLGNTASYGTGGPNQAQGQQFQQLMSGQYAGPTQLNNQQQIQNQASNVAQLGQATGSQAGQMGLLQQFVGNPQYTQGQQNLDQLLLGQTGQPQLAAARRGALQLQGQVGNAVTGAQATGQQQQAQAQNFGQNVQQQFGNTVAGINSGLQQQAQTAQQGANQNYASTLAALQSGNINQQQANLLGLTNGEQVTQGELANIGNFIQQNPNQATAQNVASGQNYAQLQALQQLGGNFAPQAAQQTLQQYAGQAGNAGTFQNQQQIQGNQAGFNTANTAALANYNGIVNPAQQNLNNANTIDKLLNTENYYHTQGIGAPNSAQLVQNAQQQLASLYPGASGGDIGNNIRWAEGQQQQDTSALQNALATANAGAGGGLTNINITPQQAALQQIQQGANS